MDNKKEYSRKSSQSQPVALNQKKQEKKKHVEKLPIINKNYHLQSQKKQSLEIRTQPEQTIQYQSSRDQSQNINFYGKNQNFLKPYSKDTNEVAAKIRRNEYQKKQIKSEMSLLDQERNDKSEILLGEKIKLNKLRRQILTEKENLDKYQQIIKDLKPDEKSPQISIQKEKFKNTISRIQERIETLQLEFQRIKQKVRLAEDQVSRIDYDYRIKLQKYNEINSRLEILNKTYTKLQNKQDLQGYMPTFG